MINKFIHSLIILHKSFYDPMGQSFLRESLCRWVVYKESLVLAFVQTLGLGFGIRLGPAEQYEYFCWIFTSAVFIDICGVCQVFMSHGHLQVFNSETVKPHIQGIFIYLKENTCDWLIICDWVWFLLGFVVVGLYLCYDYFYCFDLKCD